MDRRVFQTGVSLALHLVFAIVVVRRYGMLALATGKRARHAAMGRAKSRWYPALHHGARIGNHAARDLIRQLRRERQEMAWNTYARNVRWA